MTSLLFSIAVVGCFGWLVYHFAPAPGERWDRLLTRYRPHAPMADWSAGDYDDQRQFADLDAARTRHGSAVQS
ncbi:hypothetical protein IU501_34300 [Nocardia otitidiscaviarum]|uniref:hypothetical protein n=1 Tax=Nocardia otitidiscaviarum TaxID=1823 RepID=UPI0004A721AC|nr:hypothetical protein [Nocardia otitidiscaviarum]MBF6138042.1 hypothetical protein [Nocardia otitidiscaviarum]MBF6489084.1 hypothetical protein [Nocardia otitidiscaviarum]